MFDLQSSYRGNPRSPIVAFPFPHTRTFSNAFAGVPNENFVFINRVRKPGTVIRNCIAFYISPLFYCCYYYFLPLPCHEHSENVCHTVVYKNRKTVYAHQDQTLRAINQNRAGKKIGKKQIPFPVSRDIFILLFPPQLPGTLAADRVPPSTRYARAAVTRTREIINRTPVTNQIQITICNIRFTLVSVRLACV